MDTQGHGPNSEVRLMVADPCGGAYLLFGSFEIVGTWENVAAVFPGSPEWRRTEAPKSLT